MSLPYGRKYDVGERLNGFCCDQCMYRMKLGPKFPSDSGRESWCCDRCKQYNIGSYEEMIVDKELVPTPARYYEK